ncbi:MAG TPA: aldehyde dehydrogenase family protein [Burkholderiaceae bacterium]|jgi:acyl-CoA reductase-like NAD-dependent aldehyde dehydrogenase
MSITMEQAARAALAHPFQHTIDGQPVGSPGHFEVFNPATGLVLAHAPDATREQLDEAVAAARRSQPAWAGLTADARRQHLLSLAEALIVQREALATVITLEQGKPLARARDEVTRSAQQLQHLVALEMPIEVLKEDAAHRVELHHRPLGVVGAITPWNMPLLLSLLKAVHALYTGNTVVLKPSPYTPLTALRLGELVRGIFPAGVFNILAGGNDLGRWMTEHPGLDKISFTGSVATGKRVMAGAAATLKRVTLELGGNDAAIVRADVDPKAIASRLFAVAFANSGQICMAIKRLYVHERVHDDLCAELALLARAARVGDGFQPDVDYGPVQNVAQYRIVQELLDDARRDGAVFAAGGHALERPGYFIAPTIATGLREGSRLVDEEPFGPVLPVLRFSDDEEALQRANATLLGLSGSVWSADVGRAAALAARLEVGTAWVNQHMFLDAQVPFGGAKNSGLGSEYGLDGLKHYTQPLALYVPRG